MNADWFYSKDDTRLGPVTEDELKRLVGDDQLKPSDLVWRDGMPDWVEARTVSVLFPPKVEPLPDDSRDRGIRRTLDNAFDDNGRSSGRGRARNRDEDEDDDRPRARRRRGEDDEDDRPRRSRRRDVDDDDDRPRARRSYDDRDDYDDAPRSRRRNQRPGQIQGVGIMLLVGGILGCLLMLSWLAATFCFFLLWPGFYFELVVSILCIVRGANMLGRDDQGPPKTLAILLIICIVNLDVINCVLGIVSLVMISAPEVQEYYRKKGFY